MRTAVRCVLLFTLIGCVMCAYGLAAAAEEAAVIEDGVVLSPGAGDAPAPYPGDLAPAPVTTEGVTVINFDDVAAPCGFIETTALRDEYAGVGVYFYGPAALDGGAILNECGNFNVSGHSSPNFLAFNCASEMSDGGIPEGPEYIFFDPAVSQVTVMVGSNTSQGSLITMTAFDGSGAPLDEDSLTLSPTLAPLTVSAPGIAAVGIYSQGCVFVLDDLTFTTEGPYIAEIWTSGSNSDPTARKTVFTPGEPIVFWTVLMNHPGGQLYQDLGFIKGGKLVKVIPNLNYGDVPPGSYYLLYQATVPPALGSYAWLARARGVGYSDLYGLPITTNRITITID